MQSDFNLSDKTAQNFSYRSAVVLLEKNPNKQKTLVALRPCRSQFQDMYLISYMSIVVKLGFFSIVDRKKMVFLQK